MSPVNRKWRRRSLTFTLTGAICCAAAESRAHIDLQVPTPREQGLSREPNANLKEGPCGQVDNGRTSRVNVFAPGETIEVTWAETTNHNSYYRVAFDRSGDDAFPTFEGPGTDAEGIDPSGPCPVDGQVILAYDMEDENRGTHTLRVRLPDVECESCTLQVVQFMYDTIRPYYFQCADLALRRPGASAGSTPDGGLADAGLDASAADSGLEPEPSAAAACWSRIAPLTRTPRASDDEAEADPSPVSPPPAAADPANVTPGPEPNAPKGSESGWCSFDPPSARSTFAPTALLLALVSLLARARRAAQR